MKVHPMIRISWPRKRPIAPKSTQKISFFVLSQLRKTKYDENFIICTNRMIKKKKKALKAPPPPTNNHIFNCFYIQLKMLLLSRFNMSESLWNT